MPTYVITSSHWKSKEAIVQLTTWKEILHGKMLLIAVDIERVYELVWKVLPPSVVGDHHFCF